MGGRGIEGVGVAKTICLCDSRPLSPLFDFPAEKIRVPFDFPL